MIRRIKESEFIRNIVVLFTGSLVSQLVPFIALPILQRYCYTPADFGLLAVFVSVCELFSNVATFKLEYGIVIQRRVSDAVNLAFGALRFSWGVAAVALLLVMLFKHPIAIRLNQPSLENYLFLLPVYILLVSFNDIAAYWFNRSKRFSVLSVSKVVQTTSAESIKLLLGFLRVSFIGLIIGRMIGYLVANIYYAARFLRSYKRALKMINTKHSNQLVLDNREFIYFTTPSVFTGSLINMVYLNLFLYYFGKEVVGMIGVSTTYLSAGFGVIAVSFSQVFYSKVADTSQKEDLLKMYKRFAKNLMVLACIPVIVAYAIPSSWVTTVLGKEWHHFMEIARIMVLWLAVWFVSSSLSFIYMRLRRQKIMLFYDLLHLIIIVVGFYIAWWIQPTVISALWGFTIAQVAFYLFVIYMAIHFIQTADESNL